MGHIKPRQQHSPRANLKEYTMTNNITAQVERINTIIAARDFMDQLSAYYIDLIVKNDGADNCKTELAAIDQALLAWSKHLD